MMSTVFKRAISISLLGHITLFSIFSFSFGGRIPKINSTGVDFLGSILPNSNLNRESFINIQDTKKMILTKVSNILTLQKLSKRSTLISPKYLKPTVSLPFNKNKEMFMLKVKPSSFMQERKEPIIMFYPPLPRHFLLYFKDRQVVHIELMFNISGDRANSITIKRKTSSGNLEVDLLAMRYISHYLFIQRPRFPRNIWQTVKIDLQAKE